VQLGDVKRLIEERLRSNSPLPTLYPLLPTPFPGVDDTTKTSVFHTYRIAGDREMIETGQK
jgi:hypothetical protein